MPYVEFRIQIRQNTNIKQNNLLLVKMKRFSKKSKVRVILGSNEKYEKVFPFDGLIIKLLRA